MMERRVRDSAIVWNVQVNLGIQEQVHLLIMLPLPLQGCAQPLEMTQVLLSRSWTQSEGT